MQLSLFEYAGLDHTGLKEPKKFTIEEIIEVYKQTLAIIPHKQLDSYSGDLIDALIRMCK